MIAFHQQTIIFCFILLCGFTLAQTDIKKVNVTVFYESLCPDSKKFINTQLHPTLNSNSSYWDYINLKLIPFGKSKFFFDKTFNAYNFTCHHGEDECVGNKIHACGIEQISEGKDQFGFVTNTTLDFIDCLMMNVDRSQSPNVFPTMKCATESQVRNFAQVDSCSKHVDGQKYLANFGTLTEELKPTLKSVPTIVFNGVYKEADSKNAQVDFEKVLCEYLKLSGGMLPSMCSATGDATRVFSVTTQNIVLMSAGIGLGFMARNA